MQTQHQENVHGYDGVTWAMKKTSGMS